MSSKQNPDKICIRLNRANKAVLMKVIEERLKEYGEAYEMVGYSGYAEYLHGILGGIIIGLSICGADVEEVGGLRLYINTRMTEIEDKIRELKENQEDER